MEGVEEPTAERKELTERQRSVYLFIVSFMKRNGYPPTFRQIGAEFGIYIRGVVCHLTALEKKGWIERNASQTRGIRVIGSAQAEVIEPDTEGLNRGETKVARYVAEHTAKHGVPPTVREIANAQGWHSPNYVTELIRSLLKKGVLSHTPRLARSLTVVRSRKYDTRGDT
jgi:SOS-response transcriptional repressor LexA